MDAKAVQLDGLSPLLTGERVVCLLLYLLQVRGQLKRATTERTAGRRDRGVRERERERETK